MARRPEAALAALAAALTLAGLLAGAGVLARRSGHEGPRAGPVELVVDWEALAEAARQWGLPAEQALQRLAEAGVTTLALTELSAADLVARGQALLLAGWQLELLGRALGERSEPALAPAGADAGGSWLLLAGGALLPVPAPPPEAARYGVGFPAGGWQAARQAAVAVMLRYAAGPRLDGPRPAPETVGYGLPAGAQLSRVSIFAGEAVPPAEQAEGLLRAVGASLGLVEFTPAAPWRALAGRVGDRVAVVHSARPEELLALGPELAAERFVRAVRERGVSVLYLRPAGSWAQVQALVSRIRQRLEAEGYRLGPFQARPPFTGPGPQEAAVAAAALPGLALAGWLGWARAAGLAVAGPVAWAAGGAALGGWAAAALALLVAGAGGWEAPGWVWVRQALALLAALVGPPAAVGLALAAARAERRRAWAVAGAALAFAGVAVACGVLVGALLSDQRFMARLEVFRGVKAAHLLPVVASAALGWWAAGGRAGSWGEMGSRPVRWREGVAALAVLAAGAYYLARTGNDVAPVSSLERWLRAWLEQVLPVRPRAKEFLVGYPALGALLVPWGWGRRMRRPGPAAVLILSGGASVAAVSVINSWAHIHTPVAVTLWRVVSGLLAGSVGGLVAGAAAAAWLAAGQGAEGGRRAEGRRLGVLRVR